MVDVSTLNELEPVTIENKNYKRWSGNNLKPGSNYVITVTNRSLSIKYIDLFPVIIFAVLFLSVFIIGLITRSENKNNVQSLLVRRDEIVKTIITLDEEYKKNPVNESSYKEKRYRLKNSIIEIDKKINED